MPPQTVLDALNKLVADQADVVSKKDDAAEKKVALADAQHASEVADNAVTAASEQFKADKQSLKDLIDSTFPTE